MRWLGQCGGNSVSEVLFTTVWLTEVIFKLRPLRGHNDYFDIITISTMMNLGSNHGIMTPLFALEDWEKIMIYVIKCEQGWFECVIINYLTPFSLWCFYIPLVRTLTHIFLISKFVYLFILIPDTFSIDLEKNPWPPWFHSYLISLAIYTQYRWLWLLSTTQ